jgi:hypothetical protein
MPPGVHLSGLVVPAAAVLAPLGGVVWLALHATALASPRGAALGAGVLDPLGPQWPLALLAVWLTLLAAASAFLVAGRGPRRG